LAACVAAQGTPAAQDGEDAGGSIYQQRTADGRIVLTDRPLAGARRSAPGRLRPSMRQQPGSGARKRASKRWR
jgi:hypothetical protein